MESIVLDRRKTFFHNDFLNDYYNTDTFDNLRTYAPNIEQVGEAIKNKQGFSQVRRETLVEVLNQQYKDAHITIEGALFLNIEVLKKANTYTVTTGQQIHIGLGPLYVIYKAFDTIAIAKELSEKYPDSNFIPVFWMATEDHDLEEIAEIDVFGKKVVWETNQKGAVGRMTTEGIPALFRQIKAEFNFSGDQEEFLDTCIEIYSKAKNLSDAFRQLLHSYIGSTGIVIIDADNKKLKESFTEVIIDELHHKNYHALSKSTTLFEETGYDKQLHIRKCNLFDMATGDRVKVKGDTPLSESQGQQDVYNLSPNAALRPFYQEWILPNLVYVGGPSEIKYWLQLKGIFDNYEIPMPILHLRTSNIRIPQKVQKSLREQDLIRMFHDEAEIITYYSDELRELEARFNELHSDIVKDLLAYSEMAAVSFSGFNLKGKIDKILPKISELPSLVQGQLVKKSEQNPDLNKVLKTKEKYFNTNNIQERKDHVLGHVELLHLSREDVYSHFGLKKSQKIGLLFV